MSEKMTRAEACHLYFNSFRSYCSVNVSKDLTIEYMYLCLYSLSSSNFDMVICVDNYDKKYLIKLNEACRKNNVSFIVSGSLGLYGYMFVDFG
jgi:molybdopterin/thiamine biosynthesis adenylyltransferase